LGVGYPDYEITGSLHGVEHHYRAVAVPFVREHPFSIYPHQFERCHHHPPVNQSANAPPINMPDRNVIIITTNGTISGGCGLNSCWGSSL
jgi:hypothetical protein